MLKIHICYNVLDLHPFRADPDPGSQICADPDPGSQIYADLDPGFEIFADPDPD